jgi:O-antigen ligase
MELREKNSVMKVILTSAVINTLVLTPFFNKDGMIIPKLMVIFSAAMYLLPTVFLNYRIIFANKYLKFVTIIHILLLFQSLIVLFVSSAPLEQQIFGRTGRGLGLITIVSLSIVFIVSALSVSIEKIRNILFWLIVSSFLSSFYSILQSYGVDLISWDTKTNGVIGTLGNPNFQSAFAAVALVPSFLYFFWVKKQSYLSFLLFIFYSFVIFRTQSTQGVIAGLGSIVIVSLIYFWYKSKLMFIFISITGFIFGSLTIAGMLNYGPFSTYLYKISIQSRGDFWRSAFTTANNHPIFGVGLDSFGDYSLKYRDEVAAGHPWAEYTDNAHNFFLQQASTAGYPFAILNFVLILFVLYSFFRIQINVNKFDPSITSIFSIWCVYQMVSVISPENLVNIFWNAVISGAIVGIAKGFSENSRVKNNSPIAKTKYVQLYSITLCLVGFAVLLPLFNVDRKQLTGMKTGNANMVMEATLSFPESTVRYSLIGRELLNSGLTQQSLEIARSGIKFNPYSPASWALILVNPNATLEERMVAKNKILELDPLNKNVRDFVLQ